jgi:hypothetical protein
MSPISTTLSATLAKAVSSRNSLANELNQLLLATREDQNYSTVKNVSPNPHPFTTRFPQGSKANPKKLPPPKNCWLHLVRGAIDIVKWSVQINLTIFHSVLQSQDPVLTLIPAQKNNSILWDLRQLSIVSFLSLNIDQFVVHEIVPSPGPAAYANINKSLELMSKHSRCGSNRIRELKHQGESKYSRFATSHKGLPGPGEYLNSYHDVYT